MIDISGGVHATHYGDCCPQPSGMSGQIPPKSVHHTAAHAILLPAAYGRIAACHGNPATRRAHPPLKLRCPYRHPSLRYTLYSSEVSYREERSYRPICSCCELQGFLARSLTCAGATSQQSSGGGCAALLCGKHQRCGALLGVVGRIDLDSLAAHACTQRT